MTIRSSLNLFAVFYVKFCSCKSRQVSENPACMLKFPVLNLLIIWLCLTRTGNYKIHEFDWLKSILTAV